MEPKVIHRELWLQQRLSLSLKNAFLNDQTRSQLDAAFSDLNLSAKQLDDLLASFVNAAQVRIDSKVQQWLDTNNLQQICQLMDTRHIHAVAASRIDENHSLPNSLPTPHHELPQRTLQQIDNSCRQDQKERLIQLVNAKREKLKQLKNETSTEITKIHSECTQLKKLSSSHVPTS